MMEKNGIWSETFKIPAFMIDASRRITLTGISNFLQEVAGNHANFRKIGFHEMQASNKFWALNRLRIAMKEMPIWSTEIRVDTWVHIMKGPFSYRNFEIFDADNNSLGAASALWIAVDATKRKPVRIDSKGLPVLKDKLPPSGIPDRLSRVEVETLIATHKVLYSDLDMIHHTNNVKYLEWVLNHASYDKMSVQPKFVEINYIAETHFGDEVMIFENVEDDVWNYSLKVGEKEVTRVKFSNL